jgi:phosphoribosylformylglycinamidine synthase
LTGAKDDGPADAAVLKPIGTRGTTAYVLSAGINPEYGKHNPYRMAVSAVDEAMRNLVCVGGNPDQTALLDNFCWGDPKKPDTLGTLVEASRGCHDAAVIYGTPFISGKDSLNNEYLGSDGERHAIPPTLLISAISVIPDLNKTVTMDLKDPGSRIYLVGDFRPRLQGSHFSQVTGQEFVDGIPGQPENAIEEYRLLYQAIQRDYLRACHDLSEGGLLVAAAEMCIGGRLGMELNLDVADPVLSSFGETNGCILIEVPERFAKDFESLLNGVPMRRIGSVNNSAFLTVINQNKLICMQAVSDLVKAWKSGE